MGLNGDASLLRIVGGRSGSSALMSVAGDGSISFILNDKLRGNRSQLVSSADGTLNLTLRDKKGFAAIFGSSKLLLGKDQAVVWSAP